MMSGSDSRSTPLGVACQRLTEKQRIVVDQLSVFRSLLSTIEMEKQNLAQGLKSDLNLLCAQFAVVKNALDEKLCELTKHVQSLYWKKSQVYDEYETTIERVVEKAEVVLKNTETLLQQSDEDVFCKEYVCTSQALEESIMEMLLLPRDSLCATHHTSDSSLQVDVSEILKFVDNLKLLTHHQSHGMATEKIIRVAPILGKGSSAQDNVDTVADNNLQPLQAVSSAINCDKEKTEPNLICSNAVLQTKGYSEENSAEYTLNDSGLKTTVPANSSLETDVQCTKLKCLQLTPGQAFQVVVTRFTSPFDFSVQPYGPELVELMEEIGTFCKEEEVGLDVCPSVGDSCCALFTEDDCWYRAKVTAVKQLSVSAACSSPSVLVTVDYVDYGNSEQLPLDRLRPLEAQFTELPCQALHCSIAGIDPVFTHANDAGVVQDNWPSEVCCWLSRVMLGNPVNIVVTSCGHDNQAFLEVYLPATDLLSKDSLTCTPVPAKSLANLSNAHSSINLASFMCSSGLAKQTDSLFPDISTVPNELSESVVQRGVQTIQSESLHNHLFSANFLEPSLQPLSVQLGPSCEFSLLISRIVSPNQFFVHPIQENVASTMIELSTSLNNYYSHPANNAPLSGDCAHSGTQCCVYAEIDQQWFRGVIIDTRGSSTDKECLVYSLDYGDTNWIPLINLQVMKAEFSVYPALCVCCTLSNVGLRSESSSDEWEDDSIRYFHELTESLSLIAVVQTEGTDSRIGCSISTVLPVILYDTSGDMDVNINSKIEDYCRSNVERKDAGHGVQDLESNNSVPQLSVWNPMETDFLSGRNLYSVDNEDANMVLQDYRSTNNRLCRFYNTRAGCFQGDTCLFLHLSDSTADKQLDDGYIDGMKYVPLPSIGDWVIVMVTAIISATHFYVQMPVGCKSPLSVERNVDSNEEFSLLCKEMNLYYHQQVFTERDVIKPFVGEIVAAQYSTDSNWYRARVLAIKEDSVKVCYIDYGNISWISSSSELRCIKPEFLVTPFQAVECCLPNLQLLSTRKEEAKNTLEELVVGKVIFAHVVRKCVGGAIGLDLYCNTDEGDIGLHINKLLILKGMLKRATIQTSKVVENSSRQSQKFDSSRLIPG